jgi:hypothetical protein
MAGLTPCWLARRMKELGGEGADAIMKTQTREIPAAAAALAGLAAVLFLGFWDKGKGRDG